jgi:hypothetical protein
MNHPVDVEYIRKMVPNISDEIIEKQKSLQSGTCLGFGMAFKIPLIVRMEMPNPEPKSGNANVVMKWTGNPKVFEEEKVVEVPKTMENSAPTVPVTPTMSTMGINPVSIEAKDNL